MALIQAPVGERKTVFFNKSFPEALQSTGTFALVQPHAAQNTPLDVITRSCSPVGALADIQVPLCCGAELRAGRPVGQGRKASRPWGAQDRQELQQKHCHGDGLNVDAVKH